MRFTVQRSLGPQGGSWIRGREAHTGIRPNGSLQNDHGTIILKWLVESPCYIDSNEKQQASKPNKDLLKANPGKAHAYTIIFHLDELRADPPWRSHVKPRISQPATQGNCQTKRHD